MPLVRRTVAQAKKTVMESFAFQIGGLIVAVLALAGLIYMVRQQGKKQRREIKFGHYGLL